MRCANPECDAEVMFLRTGSLHIIDVPYNGEDAGPCRRIIWLCDSCTVLLVVEPWRPPGQQLRPRRQGRVRFRSSPSSPRTSTKSTS